MAFDASRPNANGIVDERGWRAREELREPAEVDDTTTFSNADQIYSDRRLWKRISDFVALTVDLKNSTALSFGRGW